MGTYTNLLQLTKRTAPDAAGTLPSASLPVKETVTASTPPLPATPPAEGKARLQESKNARLPHSKTVPVLASKNARLQELVGTYLALKNTRNTNFRYPPALLERLADLEYEVRKRTGKKLKTTAVLVSAVAYLLWDYEQYGEDSVLENLLVQDDV